MNVSFDLFIRYACGLAGITGVFLRKRFIDEAGILPLEVVRMPYRWNNQRDVDEAVVVVMNTVDQGQEIRGWLMRALQQAIYDSDPGLAEHFFKELERHRPGALKYFKKPVF